MASSDAHALEQPDGTPIPSEMGCDSGAPTGLAAEFACLCETPGTCNIGGTCSSPGNCPPVPSGNCEATLWHSFNDNTCIPSNRSGLDPWNDGALEPERYMPTCALTFTLVSRGTAIFRDVFGWYNVTGSRPEPSDLHVMLDCNTSAGDSVVLDVRNDPAWAGGEVAFFIATPEQHGQGGQCAGGNCCASIDRISGGEGHVYYSERSFNPDEAGADSIIHLVVYDSQISDRKFYFAWEDIFGGSNNDFTDLVTSVEGVECSGGGASCETGAPGICGYGITTCEGSGIDCVQLYQPREEKCDGADNDCDEIVDEEAGCEDDVVAGCEDVECPPGDFCRDGACVDACAHVECAPGETCRGGACLPGCNQCNGIVCSADETCDLGSGDCLGAGEEPAEVDAGAGSGPGASTPGTATGCACQSAGGSQAPFFFLFVAGFLLLRSRRRSGRLR